MESLLKDLQTKLDTQKYYQSSTARQDLSGLMSYCENCAFKRMSSEQGRFICNLDYHSVVENQVCAKNYRRNKEESKQTSVKPKRKRSNGKS